MDEKIITWNVTNWITVLLMGSIGFFLLGLAQKLWSSKKGSNGSAS